jgi:hypothetical protein
MHPLEQKTICINNTIIITPLFSESGGNHINIVTIYTVHTKIQKLLTIHFRLARPTHTPPATSRIEVISDLQRQMQVHFESGTVDNNYVWYVFFQ